MTAPVQYEVPNSTPRHRQYLGYQGGKLQLLIQNVSSDIIKLKDNEKSFSLLLPVEGSLRSQLDIIEHFAQKHADVSCLSPPTTIVSYKPLWRGSTMYIHVAPWCRFLQPNLETGHIESVDSKNFSFERGSFCITLEIPYIYVGPHKNGENASLSLSIVQMALQVEVPSPLPIKFKTTEKRGRPRKLLPANVAPTSEKV